jgi:MerR family transcriptional regulator/heat shock protein HspR
MKRRKGYYSISVVAKMFDVHQQTIRLYEKEGLITPQRTAGGTRLFSEEDVDRLEEIIHLTHKMGVNIAGVEMIMKLQRKMQKMQADMNKLFEQMSGQLEEETGELKQEAQRSAHRLVTLKKNAESRQLPKPSATVMPLEEDEEHDSSDDITIEYDNE